MADPSLPHDRDDTQPPGPDPIEETTCGGASDANVSENDRFVISQERFQGVQHGELFMADDGLLPLDGVNAYSGSVRLFPGYDVLEELGHGGMGLVFLARQLRPSRLVALKMIQKGADAGPTALARFQAESESLARLQHPNIIQVYEVGQVQGVAYFAMEYCAGGSLAGKLKSALLPAREAAALAETLARAVHAAHRAGVVHRDLKPDNILLTADGTPKIADFGLARRLDSGQRHTASQSVLGTPSYMAPEQAAGDPGGIGPPADVYSLGAVLYEMLTGRPPFRGTTMLETLEQLRSQEAVRPRRLQPRTPRDLETICLKCLQKEAKKRYPSAEALADDLRRFQDGGPIKARPVGPLGRAWRWCRRRPAAAAASALAAALAVLLLAGALWYTALLGEAEGDLVAARAKADAAQRVAAAAREAADAERYAALLSGARQRSGERRPGWTWAALSDLAAAARLDVRARRPLELRAEAATCLAGVDVRPRRTLDEGYPVSRLAFSPDGRLLALARAKAAAFSYCSIRLVDVETGEAARELSFLPSLTWQVGSGVQDGVTALAFSPDGRRLAAGMRSGMLHVWDLTQETPQSDSWQGHDGEVRRVAFGPDGRNLFSAGAGRARRWPCGGPCADPPTYDGAGVDLVLDPTGRWAACGDDRSIVLLDPITLRPVGSPLAVPHHCLAAGPDGRMIAASHEGTLQLIDARDGRILRTLRAPDRETAADGLISDLAFSPDGSLLAASSRETNRFRLWDVAGGRLLADQLVGGEARVAFAPDGRSLAATSQGQTLLFDVGGLREEAVVALQPCPVVGVAFSPDGWTLAVLARTAPGAGEATLWRLCDGPRGATEDADGRVGAAGTDPFARWSVPLGNAGAGAVAFEPTGAWLAVAHSAETTLFGTAAPTLQRRLPAPGAEDLCFDAQGRLWTASESEVGAWSAADGREVAHWSNAPSRVLTGLAAVKALAAGRDRVLAGSRDGMLHLLRAADGESQQAWGLSGGELRSAALDADGSLAAAGSENGDLHVLALPQGEQLPGARPHDDAVQAVAFAGRLLASGSRDKTVRLWRCEGGSVEELATLREPGPVDALAFSPDGDRLAVLVHGEWAVRVWRLGLLRRSLARVGLDW